ncbi:MAG TPA: response regulator, partial [Verrucomicrobiae bacterium]|nr:response regulator [Verrucomicrobiae bacterium]
MSEKMPRILYMEDDPGLARLLQKAFARLGYGVEVAEDGHRGLQMTLEESYDLLLLDYDMPGLGGMQVLQELARREGAPPVIMVTGNGSERVAVEALKAGAADYVVKDVEMGYLELLPIVVAQVLSRQALQREKQEMLAAMRESEERYRRLVELSLDGIALLDHGRFVFVNPAGRVLLGRERAEGCGIMEVLHPDHRAVFETQLRFIE